MITRESWRGRGRETLRYEDDSRLGRYISPDHDSGVVHQETIKEAFDKLHRSCLENATCGIPWILRCAFCHDIDVRLPIMIMGIWEKQIKRRRMR